MRPGTAAARSAVLALAIALAGIPVAAQDRSYLLTGQASWNGYASWADGAPNIWGWSSDSGLELGLDARRPEARASFLARIDVLAGQAAAAAALLESLSPTGAFIASGPGSAYALRLAVERAYVRLSPGPFTLTVGRQVVNWGHALLLSPADLFAETTLSGLSPGRAGTDAVRMGVPVGTMGGVELVGVPTADPADGRYGGRVYGELLGGDAGLAAAWDGSAGEWTVAAELKTDLVVGLWAEAAWSFAGDVITDGTLAATIGADWSFGSDVMVAAEYHYNGIGIVSGPIPPGTVALPARHYAFASVSVKVGDLAAVSASVIVDPANGLWSTTGALVLDAAQDTALTIWLRAANGALNTMTKGASAAAGLGLVLSF